MASCSSKKKVYFCEHCQQELSKTLFFSHKKLYYNTKLRKWQKGRVQLVEEDFTLSEDGGLDAKEDDYIFSDQDSNLEDDSMAHECDVLEENSGSEISDDEFNFDQDIDDNQDVELVFDIEEFVHASHEKKVQYPNMIKMILMFIFFWQSAFRISDVGINVLLAFFSTTLVMISKVLHISVLKDFAMEMPRTVVASRRLLGTDVDMFTRWACCPKCSSIYPVGECRIKHANGQQISKKCTFIRFPHHPQTWRRKECGATLMKKVKTSAGTVALTPIQTYCYKSITGSLEELLQRPDFIELCEKWRGRESDPSILSDVYDGSMWKEFMTFEGTPFLSTPFNFALSLNVDWFQPFKHTQHSIGVMYMAVLNLPREIRFLPENVILVGIIPGPHEPSKHIKNLL